MKEKKIFVYLLWYVEENDEIGGEEKFMLLGVFSSRKKTEEALTIYRSRKEFQNCQLKDFLVDKYQLNKDTNFVGGFMTYYY